MPMCHYHGVYAGVDRAVLAWILKEKVPSKLVLDRGSCGSGGVMAVLRLIHVPHRMSGAYMMEGEGKKVERRGRTDERKPSNLMRVREMSYERCG